MSPFVEDFSAYNDPGEFGTTVTYTPDGGFSKPVNGIFENEYSEDSGVEGSVPRFECSVADVLGVKQGDSVVINSVFHTVSSVQPDGTGWVVLVLEKV